MSSMPYIRDEKSGVLVLGDVSAAARYRERRAVCDEIKRLKDDINTLKTQVFELRTALETLQKSK